MPDGEFGEAAAMLRLGLMQDPHNAEAHFHLADCLYRQDNVAGALERYYAAGKRSTVPGGLDPDRLPAPRAREPESALDAFDIAKKRTEIYPDAHFQKAETLAELGRVAEAAPYWRRYLSYEDRGPWAELARERLNELR
ncbi:MAG: tetratricopeptide repeat protein [Planctomycetaceae bacterium]